MTSKTNISLVEKSAADPRKERLGEIIAQKSYIVRNGAVSDAGADNALQAKRHQRRMEAKARL